MYQHILLAVALQQWDEFSPHAVAAREAAVALAHGSGAQLSVLSVYDYDTETPEALSLSSRTWPVIGTPRCSGSTSGWQRRCRRSWPACRPTRPRSHPC